ncbi:MAG: hypothetical protein ABIJ09_16045 [Pseudomonadota bacterium]
MVVAQVAVDLLVAATRVHRQSLIDGLGRQIRLSTATHYLDAGAATLDERCEAVVDAMLRSLEEGPAHFIEHVRHVAVQRQAEGFRLSEVQLVLATLEEQLWCLACQVPADTAGLVAVLARVSGTIGAAKDALARVFLDQLRDREAQLDRIAQHALLLFQGTDSSDGIDATDLDLDALASRKTGTGRRQA